MQKVDIGLGFWQFLPTVKYMWAERTRGGKGLRIESDGAFADYEKS